MKHNSTLITAFFSFSLFAASVNAATPEKSFEAPNGLKITVKQIGPVTQATDLQVITLLKHNPAGDKYIEAMQDFNDKQGALVQTIRERGEFIGELGETILYTPPAGSITPKQVLLIGLGDEKELNLDKLKVAGRIALREAVRLKAKHVSFAPTLRDQGSTLIEVGEGDGVVVAEALLAYDTEKRLQLQKLSPQFDVENLVIEAGPKYYTSVNAHIETTINSTSETIKSRSGQPHSTLTTK